MQIDCTLKATYDLTKRSARGERWTKGDIAHILRLMANGKPVYVESQINSDKHPSLRKGMIVHPEYYADWSDNLGFSPIDDRATFLSRSFTIVRDPDLIDPAEVFHFDLAQNEFVREATEKAEGTGGERREREGD